jgi:hypothetical protein
MTIQELLDAVMAVEREIEKAPRGGPELEGIIGRIRELQAEVDRVGGLQGPLVPDAASPKSPEERTTVELGQALDSLMSAAHSKQ